jgi:hypothetical protein
MPRTAPDPRWSGRPRGGHRQSVGRAGQETLLRTWTAGRLPGERALLHSASDDRTDVYVTGSHIWNNLHDGMGPGAACPQTPEQFDYIGYLRLPGRAWSQLHPALALGAAPVPGCWRRLPPVHDATAVGANRRRSGEGRQAEVRPRPLRPGLLRPAPGPRGRRGRARHLRRGDALRGLGAAPSRDAGTGSFRSAPSSGAGPPRRSEPRGRPPGPPRNEPPLPYFLAGSKALSPEVVERFRVLDPGAVVDDESFWHETVMDDL